jgi:UDP-2,3-diacylglucosamine hydrolase
MVKAYFASDFHLGAPDQALSRQRERLVVSWLNQVGQDADYIFLLGDVFDFWFEYNQVVPKHFTRLLGKIGELTDRGVKIYYFKGNHDMWTFGYLEDELGVEVISDELRIELGGKHFFLHHGDGLGKGDRTYKMLRRIFRNPICQRLFSWIPSRIGMGIANSWSRNSRIYSDQKEVFTTVEDEWLYQFCESYDGQPKPDYFIFGHRHLAMDEPLSSGGRYINLGEWVHAPHYAVFDGKDVKLKKWEGTSS